LRGVDPKALDFSEDGVMPIYEYRCSACGHEMSHFHRTRSEAAPPCEACGEHTLEKQISLTSFSLKGEGWYVTDYKSNGKKTSSDTSSTTSESTSTDSKATDTKTSSSGSESASVA